MARKSTSSQNVNIFAYTDFRRFIKDRYRRLKSIDRSLTYAKIGLVIGFSSPGFFTQIIQGKSRIPANMVPKFCTALKLTKKESAHFRLLVEYGQADTHERMHELFKKVLVANAGSLRTLSPDQYVLFDKWYYTVVHELLHYQRFDGDYRALSRMLLPPITPSQAREAIDLLVRLNLIKKNDAGAYVRSDAQNLTTGFHPESVAINNYLLEMMKLAQCSIETCQPEQRSLSTLTVSLSENGYRRLEQEMHEFRRRLLSLANEDMTEDRLYQINLQMFPLVKINAKNANRSSNDNRDPAQSLPPVLEGN